MLSLLTSWVGGAALVTRDGAAADVIGTVVFGLLRCPIQRGLYFFNQVLRSLMLLGDHFLHQLCWELTIMFCRWRWSIVD
jgi:hypothetical protein